jgi:SAM-dependent methyltransferase
LQVQVGDITDPHLPGQIGEQFDLIIMRDVIEHVSDRETTMANLNALLSKSGYLYITFPPKYSAYGGHQQTASSAVRFIPFFHVLPAAAVQKIGGWFKEKPGALEQIRQIFQNGLTVAEFEKLCARHDLCVKIKGLFLSRPVFKIRYNLPVIPCPDLPLFREFMASGCEYLLQK